MGACWPTYCCMSRMASSACPGTTPVFWWRTAVRAILILMTIPHLKVCCLVIFSSSEFCSIFMTWHRLSVNCFAFISCNFAYQNNIFFSFKHTKNLKLKEYSLKLKVWVNSNVFFYARETLNHKNVTKWKEARELQWKEKKSEISRYYADIATGPVWC